MKTKKIVRKWFKRWESGDFLDLPIADDFKHTSPYGTIEGKDNYTALVESNKDKFLGHKFKLIDEIYYDDTACVRYTAIQGDFRLEVSEWYYLKKKRIKEIVAYYNIDERRITIDN